MSPEEGLQRRYAVERLDDAEGKHDQCWYFVLDPKHDPIAAMALIFYAGATENAALSRDIRKRVTELRRES